MIGLPRESIVLQTIQWIPKGIDEERRIQRLLDGEDIEDDYDTVVLPAQYWCDQIVGVEHLSGEGALVVLKSGHTLTVEDDPMWVREKVFG